MVAFEDIEAAARRIAPAIVRTPLLQNDQLDAILGARVFVKAECLQRFGAFKLRGAYNKIAALDKDVRARGVIAFSSGNHGIAVAGAAKDFAIPAAIVMPSDAPVIKIRAIEALGGEIIYYDRVRDDREAIGEALARTRGAALVKPFDDALVIAGQGTIGLEIGEDISADIVLCPAGGGGLASGIAIALAQTSPGAALIGVEPAGHDDLARSLEAGARVSNPPGTRSICDGLLTAQTGELTFEILKAHLEGVAVVNDADVLAAMAFGFAHLKIVLEPSGAVALAAALSGMVDVKGKTVAIIASGGNVDAALFARALAAAPENHA